MSDTTGGGTTDPTDPTTPPDPGVHRGAEVKPTKKDDDTPPDPGVHRG
jgi:hypothetical protein